MFFWKTIRYLNRQIISLSKKKKKIVFDDITHIISDFDLFCLYLNNILNWLIDVHLYKYYCYHRMVCIIFRIIWFMIIKF